MLYNIFLDDIRKPLTTNHVNLPLLDWTIVRSYKDFVDIIKTQGLPRFISFDHDLATEHYPTNTDEMDLKYRIEYDKMKEKTGYHCALWLTNYCVEQNMKLPNYMVHSMNPAGSRNIIQVLERFKQYQREQEENGFVWKQI